MKKRVSLTLILFIAVFAALLAANVKAGSVSVHLTKQDETARIILYQIRLPRMTASVILGGALALSGFLLQTFFNNPIATPYVLGISGGAKLMVALLMVLSMSGGAGFGSWAMVFAAFVGAMLSMGFVLLIARAVKRSAMLIVSGIMIGYICAAITDFVVTFASDANIVNLHNWSKGSFSGTAWADVRVMAIVVFIAAAASFLLSKPISAYQLGESYAQSVGVNIKLFRTGLVILSGILCACVTAFAGPVSFVGIAVPHLVKAFLKTSRPLVVIPFCFFGGAIFCLGADLIARTLFSPQELSISSVTAVIGAPVVISILVNRKARE